MLRLRFVMDGIFYNCLRILASQTFPGAVMHRNWSDGRCGSRPCKRRDLWEDGKAGGGSGVNLSGDLLPGIAEPLDEGIVDTGEPPFGKGGEGQQGRVVPEEPLEALPRPTSPRKALPPRG